jgi:HK97 family phage portal protein
MNIRSLVSDFKTIWLGDTKHFDEQVIQPLLYGTQKNHYTTKDAEKISVVTNCIKILSDNLSRIPVNIYKSTQGGNLVYTNDNRNDLLYYSPDGILTAQTFFQTLEYNRNYTGNAFAIIHRVNGIVNKLEVIPTAQVVDTKFVRGQLYYKVYRVNEANKTVYETINANDMLHFKMMSKNGLWGINPIESQRLNLSTLYKSKNTADNFWTNNAHVPAFLENSIPDANAQKLFQEAVKNFKQKYSGPSNAGEIGILPPWSKVQQLNLNIIDEKFLLSTKFDSAAIASWYGVPLTMIGITEATKFANAEYEAINFRSNTLSSIISVYTAELKLKLLTNIERKNGLSIEFKINALLDADIKTKIQYYKDLFSLGVISGNQIAVAEGFPTYEGGDIHFIPTNNLTPITHIDDEDIK